MKLGDHGGSVQAIEAGKFLAKCRCRWQTVEDNKLVAERALDDHVSKHMTRGDEGGRVL